MERVSEGDGVEEVLSTGVYDRPVPSSIHGPCDVALGVVDGPEAGDPPGVDRPLGDLSRGIPAAYSGFETAIEAIQYCLDKMGR